MGLQEPVQPEIWVPYTVSGSGLRGVLVRTSGDPMMLMNDVRREVWATDRSVALTFTGSLDNYINSLSYAGPRFGFVMMGIFAAVGLVLVTIGVYSAVAYEAARRTHEIGIRMALGASRGDALRLVLGRGLRVIAVGVVMGLAASLAAELWRVSAHDPLTIVCVAALLVGTRAAACWIPARRAVRVDPMAAVRYE
jgi:putative ABC transport system permease protein